jgi:hypothetical protein
LQIASAFPQCRYYFHKNNGVIVDDFQANHEYLTNQRRRNLPVGESRQGPSGEPATELAKRTGDWMLRDEPEKALTANVITERNGKSGLCSQGPHFLKWQSVVIRGPYRVFEKSEGRGDFLEREIAP